jgi:isocitrate dehydrogenase
MTDKAKTYNGIAVPAGEKITFQNGKPVTPDHPIIPFIEGDGIGTDIWPASRKIIDAAVRGAYGDTRSIAWLEVLAGDKAKAASGVPLPQDTLDAITEFGVAIKGPLGTPTGGGMRSLNVTMRQKFDLYRCVRPVRYFSCVPSVVVHPEKLDVVIFRENTEDVYAGIEYKADSAEAVQIVDLLGKFGVDTIEATTGIGIKIISRRKSRRLVKAAIEYALESGRKTVTLVHKGNIQKFTEGAFRDWGYELAREEFADKVVTEDELWSKHNGKLPDGKILLNDRIADAMFFEVLTKPSEFSVIATCNLNGDYLSDACAAQVGGLGIAPGANIGTDCAIFEATHGTWPKGAGKNLANPSSLLLSGVMMLEFMGWKEAAQRIVTGLEKTIASKNVTVDLHTLMEGATLLSTSEFADAVIANMPEPVKVQAPVAAAAASAPADSTGKDSPAQSVGAGAKESPASSVTAGSESVEPASTPQVAAEASPGEPVAETNFSATADGGAPKTSDGSKPAAKADAGAKDAK